LVYTKVQNLFISNSSDMLNRYIPNEITKSVKKTYVALMIIALLISVIALNVFAYHKLKISSPNKGYAIIHKKWDLLFNKKQRVDWLILGDSSGNQGINTERIKKQTGKNALNLCTIGNFVALDDAWMLDTYLKKYGAPEKVIIVHVYDTWHRPFELSGKVYQNLYSQIPLLKLKLSKTKPSLNLSFHKELNILGDKYFPIVSQQKSLKMLTLGNRNHRWKNSLDFTDLGYMYWDQANATRVESDANAHLKNIGVQKAYFSDASKAGLDYIKQLAEQHKFDVYLVNSPLYKGMLENSDFVAYYKSVNKLLHTYCNTSNYLHHINADPITFEKSMMQNVDHLTSEGALIYTDHILDLLGYSNN
jgi:hypothetical protein